MPKRSESLASLAKATSWDTMTDAEVADALRGSSSELLKLQQHRIEKRVSHMQGSIYVDCMRILQQLSESRPMRAVRQF